MAQPVDDLTFPPTNIGLNDIDPGQRALYVKEYRFQYGYNVLYEAHGCLQEIAWFRKVLRHHYPEAIISAVKREGLGWFSFKASRPLERNYYGTTPDDYDRPDPVG